MWPAPVLSPRPGCGDAFSGSGDAIAVTAFGVGVGVAVDRVGNG